MACKAFHTDGRAGSFRKELRRLGWVKEAKEDIRIMKHIAALAHGGNVMILLPLAEHFDLDVFLRHGFKPTRSTEEAEKLYDFNSTFPGLEDDNLSAALVNELCELAFAIQWLHEGNEASQSLYSSLAHMDLKPENILVAKDPNSLIGKWMLSDFGVSLFSRSQAVSQGQSAHSTGSSYLDEPRRGCGTYQPPEIKHLGIDGRKCDVWSFGCILLDVLSFALGRTKLFQEVRAKRNFGGDDYFYETKIGRTESQVLISDANTRLKTQIRRWLKDEKRSTKHPRWVRCYIDVIERTLKCDPQDRPGIRSVVCDLKHVRQGKKTAIHHFSPLLVDRWRALSSDTRTSTMLMEAETARAFESAPGRLNNRVQHFNTAGHDRACEVESRDSDEASMNSETSFDTDTASLPTSIQIMPYSPMSDRAGPQYDSRDCLGRQRRDSVVTNSSGSILIGLCPEPRPPIPTRLALRSGAQSLPDRPLSANVSPEKISSTSLHVKDAEKIIALALSPSGDQAALLFGHVCRVYATSGDIASEPISGELSRKVQWTRLCIGSQYLVVYGTERGAVFENRVSCST